MNAVCEVPNPKSIRKLKRPYHEIIYVPKFDDERRAEKIKIPDMVYEVDEVLRLMRRKPAEKQHDNGCLVCGRGDHFEEDCPCFEKIPLGVELDREYDQVCIGCGKIGETCCSKGAYAVLRRCGACGAGGHWYWDDKCDKDFVPYERVELSFFKDLLAAEQSSLQNKEDDQVMVDLGKDNKKEDDYDKEEDGAKVIFDDESHDERRAEKIKIPDMVYEVDEVLRLMRRKPAEKQHDNGCLVCGRGDHFEEDCPCFEKIPLGVELDREYDQVCIGCGKIGETCCSKGAYAVLRRCGACGAGGHWYWDDKCDKDFVPYERVELSFFKDLLAAEQSSLQNKEDDQVMVDLGKDNKKEDDYDKEEDGAKVIFDDESHDERRAEKIKIPDMVYEVDEVLRLMRRKPAEKQHDNGCLVCGRGDHFEEDCPCFEKIPLGVELDREYDQVCIGCGKIGEICCSKGAYAVLRRCGACGAGGHWYWDDKCDKDFVPYERVELSFFKDLLAAEQSSLQNKEEDQVMVDLGKDKDNKNEDDCGTEEYGPKGGNQSSYQGRCKFKLLSELEGEVVFRSQVDDSKNLFSLPKHLPSPKELRLLQLRPTTQAGLSWSKDVEAAEYYNQALKQNRQVSRHGLGYQGPR